MHGAGIVLGLVITSTVAIPADISIPSAHVARTDDDREAFEFTYALHLARQKRANNGKFRRAFGLLGYKRPADGGVPGRGYRFTDGV